MKLNNSINHNLVEKMMGHKRGLDGVYLTPTVGELFNEFKKAIPEFTIDDSERVKLEKKKLEQDEDAVEKQRLENEELLNRIEELEYGAKARTSGFLKKVYPLQDDPKRRVLETILFFWFEMRATEEEKRKIWRKLSLAQETGETVDFSILGESKGLSLKNLIVNTT